MPATYRDLTEMRLHYLCGISLSRWMTSNKLLLPRVRVHNMKVIVSRSCGFVARLLIRCSKRIPRFRLSGSITSFGQAAISTASRCSDVVISFFTLTFAIHATWNCYRLVTGSWMPQPIPALAGVDAPWCCVLRQIFVGLPGRSSFAVPSSTAQRYFSDRLASEEELLHEW